MATSGSVSFEWQAKTDSEQFSRIKAKLKEADRELRLGFLGRVRAILAPLKVQISESALQKLPKKGGLAERIAKSKYSVRNRPTSVTLQTINPYQIQSIDNGRIRHPVFGHMDRWVPEPVSAGFWTDPTEKFKPIVEIAIRAEMDIIIRKME
jgi:hypothetical protein